MILFLYFSFSFSLCFPHSHLQELFDIWQFYNFLLVLLVSFRQLLRMAILLVLPRVRAIRKGFLAPIALVSFDVGMLRYQMLFERFHSLELRLANLAGEMDDVAVFEHVLLQRSLRVELEVALWTVIGGFSVSVDMLGQCACSFEGFLANWTDVGLDFRMNLFVLVSGSFLEKEDLNLSFKEKKMRFCSWITTFCCFDKTEEFCNMILKQYFRIFIEFEALFQTF